MAASSPSGSEGQPAESTASLLSRIARGDRDALASMYDVLAPIVHGMLRRRGMGEQASAVVLESLFLRIWQEAPRLHRSASSESTWVLAQITASLGGLRLEAPPGGRRPRT